VLDALLRGLPADWTGAEEGPGTWSSFDVLDHLIHGERTHWIPRVDRQPPVAVIEATVAVRLHLDDTPADNGALRVLPGSHRAGRLSEVEVSRLRREIEEVVCPVPAGGAMLLRPLLLHASSSASHPDRRRVLHFEYSGAELPAGLEWA
jgi:ectoine hydroxylase-related dioxygenase (phytanoyl-CoA dioxygenase family)